MHLKMSSAKWSQFRVGMYVLTLNIFIDNKNIKRYVNCLYNIAQRHLCQCYSLFCSVGYYYHAEVNTNRCGITSWLQMPSPSATVILSIIGATDMIQYFSSACMAQQTYWATNQNSTHWCHTEWSTFCRCNLQVQWENMFVFRSIFNGDGSWGPNI